MTGIVYLVHLDSKIAHSQHYLGYSSRSCFPARINHHRNGTGARFLQVARERGIGWRVVRTWPGDRALERRLKNWNKGSALCPECKALRKRDTVSTHRRIAS